MMTGVLYDVKMCKFATVNDTIKNISMSLAKKKSCTLDFVQLLKAKSSPLANFHFYCAFCVENHDEGDVKT
jgi:hypothetical protein